MHSSSECIVLWTAGSKTASMGAMQRSGLERQTHLIENPIANLFFVKPALEMRTAIGGSRGSEELLASVPEAPPTAAETLHEHATVQPSNLTVLTSLSLEQLNNHLSEKRAAPPAAATSSGCPSRTPPAPDSPLNLRVLRSTPRAAGTPSIARSGLGSPIAASEAIDLSRPLSAKLTNRLTQKRTLYLRRRRTADLSLALALVGILFAVSEIELYMDLELHRQNSTSARSFDINADFLVLSTGTSGTFFASMILTFTSATGHSHAESLTIIRDSENFQKVNFTDKFGQLAVYECIINFCLTKLS